MNVTSDMKEPSPPSNVVVLHQLLVNDPPLPLDLNDKRDLCIKIDESWERIRHKVAQRIEQILVQPLAGGREPLEADHPHDRNCDKYKRKHHKLHHLLTEEFEVVV